MWRHGHTGFLWATYGIDGGTTEAVRASLLCAPSGPPANAPGPPLGIANGRDAQEPTEEGDPSAGSCVLWRADDPEDDDLTYTQVTCLACAQAYLVNPKTGKVLGSDDE